MFHDIPPLAGGHVPNNNSHADTLQKKMQLQAVWLHAGVETGAKEPRVLNRLPFQHARPLAWLVHVPGAPP